MIGMTEICRRAQTGPAMSGETFDLDVVYANARRLCEEYGIGYDPDTPVPADDGLADRVYQAAVDFVAAVGVYCPDTGRVIQFTREEILAAVADGRGRCVMGEGKDRHVWTPRRPDSETPPWHHVGTGIVNSDEGIAFDLVRAYAGIEQAHSVSVPAMQKIAGHCEKGKA